MRGSLSPDVASLIRATPINTEGFFAGACNAPGATVARMSAAICGAAFPGYRFAHPGYTGQYRGFFAGACNDPVATVARMSAAICGAAFPGYRFAHPGYTGQHGGLLRWRLQRPRRNRSPHERSDMRGSLSPDVASLIRATSLNTEGFSAGARNVPGATVATVGAVLPGYRYAHPGYIGQHGGLLRCVYVVPSQATVARMSAAICGASFPDIAEPVIGRAFARPVGSSGLHRSTSCPRGHGPIPSRSAAMHPWPIHPSSRRRA